MRKKRILPAVLCLALLTGCSGDWISEEKLEQVLEAAEKSGVINVEREELVDATLPPLPDGSTFPEGGVRSVEDVYLVCCQYLESFCNEFTIEGKTEEAWLQSAYERIQRERPDLFWVTGYAYSWEPRQTEMQFLVLDDMNSATLRSMYVTLRETADRIAAEAQRRPDDFGKAVYVHDYLVQHCEYDEAGAARDALSLGYTAYGCLVNGSAVCQGYAGAFQLIMQRLGIPAGVCLGTAKEQSHAWNYVSVNGRMYWLDVTWDDPVGGDPEMIPHSYCLFDDTMLYRSRTLKDPEYAPKCSNMEDNYFVRQGDYLTGYQFGEIDRRMKAADGNGIEVMFADEESYLAAIRELFTEEKIWDAAVFRGLGGSYTYSRNDEMYVLRIKWEK